MKLFLCVLLVAFAWVEGRVGEECQAEAECVAGECCQILRSIMVASKRQLSLIDPANNKGTCQLYKTENQTCSGFEKINGYCGCGPGLQCHSYQLCGQEIYAGPGSRHDVENRVLDLCQSRSSYCHSAVTGSCSCYTVCVSQGDSLL